MRFASRQGSRALKGMTMIDSSQEEKLPVKERLRLYARRLQVWPLCGYAACHRARAGDLGNCAARQRKESDPERQILVAALTKKLEGLRGRMMKET
jgi:hypothetical protein